MFLSMLCLLFTTVGAFAVSTPSEYQVKAAFLYNFSRFVDWPSGSFAQSGSPLVIGVVGQDPFGSSLDKVTDGKTVDGRNIIIRRFRRVSDMEPCHILFISDSEREAIAPNFRSYREQSDVDRERNRWIHRSWRHH
jgi:hypothetical protein